jgi:hypothetical protein
MSERARGKERASGRVTTSEPGPRWCARGPGEQKPPRLVDLPAASSTSWCAPGLQLQLRNGLALVTCYRALVDTSVLLADVDLPGPRCSWPW